jgi:hypothetical protein
VLITVTGASDYGSVIGLRSDNRQGLLELGRPAAEPLLVLTPRHLLLEAREQAHVLVAAHPNARVCVLPLDHHALTLVLIAEALAASPAADEGWVDPSEAVQLAQRYAARSESLVWYRTMWGLDEPTPTAGQLASGLFRRSGYIRELAADPAVIPARPGSPVALGATVHHVEGAPAQLGQQLGEVDLVPVGVTVEPGPYSNRSSVELTLLAGSDSRSTRDHHCGSCGAGLVAGHCPFCGHGPWVAAPTPNRPASNRPDRQRATSAPDAVVVPMPSAPVPIGAGGPNPSEGSPT